MAKKSKDYKVVGHWLKGDRKTGKIERVEMDMSISQETEDLMDLLKEANDFLAKAYGITHNGKN